MGARAVEIDDLSQGFGGTTAVDGVSPSARATPLVVLGPLPVRAHGRPR